MKDKDTEIFKLNNHRVLRGERKSLQLEAGGLYDYTKLSLPVEIIRGKEKGPVLFISAAIHGDEINGVEVIRRILKSPLLKRIKGTLILVPVVNVFGFNNKSRYLPDRRDLNRCFPGRKTGSLGSQLAHMFFKEIVLKSSHGIDLHTGAIHRTNLPHIRACLNDTKTKAMARNFGTSVIINSRSRDGSLREAARKKGVSTLLFEGGEALRFEKNVIKAALDGCFKTMKFIGMIDEVKVKKKSDNCFIAKNSYWVRASQSGVFSSTKKVGDYVNKNDSLATISDLFGRESTTVRVPEEGVIIGASKIPLVNRGDAMFHIATFKTSRKIEFETSHDNDEL